MEVNEVSMSGRDRKEVRKEGQALTFILQFSLNMIVPILGLTALGFFLDTKCGTNYILFIGFGIGALAGFTSNYKLSKQFIVKDEQSSLNPTAGIGKEKKDKNEKKDK